MASGVPRRRPRRFQAVNPATGERLHEAYPMSAWDDCDAALTAAARAADELRRTSPESIARFLTRFAERLEARQSAARRAGTPRDGAAEIAAAGRCRAATDDESAAPGGGCGAGRIVGASDDRHEESDPFVVRASGSGCGVRPEQLSLRLQWRRRWRFCGGDCRRKSGDCERTSAASRHLADAGRGSVRGGQGMRSARRQRCS